MRRVTAELKLRLGGGPDAVAAARSALEPLERHLGSGPLQDLRLLVSELVTNSVRHATAGRREPVELEVLVSRGRVRAQVTDAGPGFMVAARGPDDDPASGWGLYLVETLADRWGVESRRGTRVWFEIDLPSSAAA